MVVRDGEPGGGPGLGSQTEHGGFIAHNSPSILSTVIDPAWHKTEYYFAWAEEIEMRPSLRDQLHREDLACLEGNAI